MAQEPKYPIKDFRVGKIQAGIWRNEVEKNGQTVVHHSVRIQKRFRKEDGDYEDTNYFFPDDLPKLALLANKSFEFIALRESQEEDEQTPV